jgi:septation ring formation regulator EzrA
LEASQRGVSQEELEKEQEVQQTIASKVESLTGSLSKMSERSETMRLELAKLQETASLSKTTPSKKEAEDLNETRRQVVYETAKVGAVLETMQGQLAQKLKIARKNAEKSSLDLALVREIWRCAKDDVTECQAELDKCKSGIAEVSTIDMT